MFPHLKYLHYLLRHKAFVFRAGLRTKAPLWQLLIHDWSKFLPIEWLPYVTHFYGADRGKPNRASAPGFKRAFLHHVHHNPHHWQHWVSMSEHIGIVALPVPEKYIREMVADWMGAGRAIQGSWDNVHVWWAQNEAKLVLHAETRLRVLELLEEMKQNG